MSYVRSLPRQVDKDPSYHVFQYVLRFRWVFLFRSDSVKVLVYIMWARFRQLVY